MTGTKAQLPPLRHSADGPPRRTHVAPLDTHSNKRLDEPRMRPKGDRDHDPAKRTADPSPLPILAMPIAAFIAFDPTPVVQSCRRIDPLDAGTDRARGARPRGPRTCSDATRDRRAGADLSRGHKGQDGKRRGDRAACRRVDRRCGSLHRRQRRSGPSRRLLGRQRTPPLVRNLAPARGLRHRKSRQHLPPPPRRWGVALRDPRSLP